MPFRFDPRDLSVASEISVGALQSYVRRYKEERLNFLSQYIGEDSRQIWISKALFLEFLNRNPNATGVRIYFGVAEESSEGFNKGVHNLVFVATAPTEEGDADMLNDNNWVIVTDQSSVKSFGDFNIRHCPPPRQRCPGRLTDYESEATSGVDAESQ